MRVESQLSFAKNDPHARVSQMYDATALTTPAPAKGPHFRAVYDPITSTLMLKLATDQAELQDTKPPGLSFQGFVLRTGCQKFQSTYWGMGYF